jgi:hypothetical protein
VEGPTRSASYSLCAISWRIDIGIKTNSGALLASDEGRLLWIEGAKTRAGDVVIEVPEILRPHLLRLAAGREPDAPLFPRHTTQ